MDIDFRLPAVPADEKSFGLEVDSLSERGSYVYYQADIATLAHLSLAHLSEPPVIRHRRAGDAESPSPPSCQ